MSKDTKLIGARIDKAKLAQLDEKFEFMNTTQRIDKAIDLLLEVGDFRGKKMVSENAEIVPKGSKIVDADAQVFPNYARVIRINWKEEDGWKTIADEHWKKFHAKVKEQDRVPGWVIWDLILNWIFGERVSEPP